MRWGLIILPLIVGLSACSPWPPHGEDGNAEAFYQQPAPSPRDYGGSLHSRLSCQSTRLETLRLVGAEVKRPGLVRDASEAWGRASRSVNAGLREDARRDLDEVDKILYELAAQLGGLETERSRKRLEWMKKGCPI